MLDECAFDQQQQEEAALFWAVSDTLDSIKEHGVKAYLDALCVSLSEPEKQIIKSYFEEVC
jgi:hypothetical protein